MTDINSHLNTWPKNDDQTQKKRRVFFCKQSIKKKILVFKILNLHIFALILFVPKKNMSFKFKNH